MIASDMRSNIEVSSLTKWIDEVVDFRPYLHHQMISFQKELIQKYYVDLTVRRIEVRRGQIVRDTNLIKPIDQLVDNWLNEPEAGHLSILGDFGTGKSWFAALYANRKAEEYLRDSINCRVPILFSLANFDSTTGVLGSIARFLSEKGVNSRNLTEALSYLNKQGKLFIILDGFDEMEQRVDISRSAASNFIELSPLLRGKSKVLTTCRSHYFKHLSETVQILNPIPDNIVVPTAQRKLISMGINKGKYRLAEIMPLNTEDIKVALQKRIPDTYESVYDKIQSIYDLGGLAGRPVLLDLIAATFPEINDVSEINQLILYEKYFSIQSKRNYIAGKSPLKPEQRLAFVEELAWDMFVNQMKEVSYEEFSKKISNYFGVSAESVECESYERDIRTQLYFIRDDLGNYRFGHESFKEYLVAIRIARGLKQGNDLYSMLGDKIVISGQRLYLRGIYKFLNFLIDSEDEPFLLKLVESPHIWERFLAIYLLGRPKSFSLRPSIVETFSKQVATEPDIMTRRETCFALARLGEETYLQEFVKELKQNRELMENVYRMGYFDYHQDRGGPIEEMRWRLENKVDHPARIEYIHFLGVYGEPKSIPAIKPYLRDSNPVVSEEAKEAIKKLRERWNIKSTNSKAVQ